MEKRKLFINGQWIDGDSGKFIGIENPATKEIFEYVPEGNEVDVNRAVAAAKSAFSGWKELSGKQRGKYIGLMAEYLEKNKEKIGATITKEMGAPKKIAVDWHVTEPIEQAYFFSKLAENFAYETRKEGVTIYREPWGVVAAITPWNYPLDQITVKILPALAAGNTVVLKPSQQAPLAAYHIIEAAEYAGLPQGVLNLVTGKGGAVGNVLANHKDVRVVSFTGSTTAGIDVGKMGMNSLKKIILELGGKSPVVMLEDGDINETLDWTLTRMFLNSGQTCCAPTRLIVPIEKKTEVEKLVLDYTKRLKVGDPLDETTDLGPVVSERAFYKIKEYIESGINEGANVLIGSIPDNCDDGYYVPPVVFTDVKNDMKIAQEEICGPVLSIIYYETEEEALQIANDNAYGLIACVFGGHERALAFAKNVEAGSVNINGSKWSEYAPFGGYKASGIGRENSEYGFDEYLQIKSLIY